MRLIIVSNRLPVTISEDIGTFCFKPSVGGLSTGMKAYFDSLANKSMLFDRCLWIGWPGMFIEEERRASVKEMLAKEFNYLPVFMDKEGIEDFYSGFCNKIIWPLFHDFHDKIETRSHYWDSYQQINNQYSIVINEVLQADDIVWIHDYHLMLLPRLIRTSFPEALIGFFLHIPFPSFELLKTLNENWLHEIFTGIMGANLIGFHTSSYARNFEISLGETLKVQRTEDCLLFESRKILVGAYPMNIDYSFFHSKAQAETASVEVETLLEAVNNNRIILSVDRLDYTKGILNKLLAIERFFDHYPDWLDSLTLLLIVVPSRVELMAYKTLKEDIDLEVERINRKFGRFGWFPILYQYKQFSLSELAIIYSSCDIALITSIRDGMNLVAKEYIASRINQTGVLILSSGAGASEELEEALLIDPYNIEEISQAIFKALSFTPEEQIKTNTALQSRLKNFNVIDWAEEMIKAITGRTCIKSIFKS